MRITIFGATGQVGVQVIKQALAKNYTVKAFGRNIENFIDKDLRTENFVAIKGYLFNEDDVLNALEESDVVVSCIGGNVDGVDKTRSLGIKNIVSQMQKTSIKKIIAIGGEGVLNANDDTLIFEDEEYPETLKPVAVEHLAALDILKKSNLNWTFICPPHILNKDFTGHYTTSISYLPTTNIAEINVGNIADCILNCAKLNTFINQKIGIRNT